MVPQAVCDGSAFCTRAAVLLAVFVLSFAVIPVEGDCVHDGQLYANRSVWQPSPCDLCSCHDPVPVCQRVQCHDPLCNYSNGEQLQTLKEECCPVCVQVGKHCTFQGHAVPDKTSWSPAQCTTCACDDGKVRCGPVTCPPVTCKPGQVAEKLPGQCCLRCLPSGRPCTDEDGNRREDGAEWSPLQCVLCVCRDGFSKCLPRQCPAPNCPQNDVVAPGEGQCCPTCRTPQCQHQGHLYQEGTTWQPDPCTTCLCHVGQVHCTSQQCAPSPRCQQGEVAVTAAGRCCPTCVQRLGACHVKPMRYHGDLWNISDCEFCMCQNGNVQCRTLACPNVQCGQGQVRVHSVGKCCAECVTPPVCHHGNRTFHDGSTWDADACTVCTCLEGEVRCYHKTCPQCPQGQSRLTRHGQCCGHCEAVQCSPACLTCLADNPAHCTACREAGRLLQSGQCTQLCHHGFYPVANNTCLACDGSCETCIDGTRHHCTSCRPPSLLKEGQCVRQCGPGYFLQDTQCLACDVSCNTCSGPGPAQCLTCARDGQLTLKGTCVDACPSAHYPMDGDCVACPSSCQQCVRKEGGPQCTSCQPNTFLHHEHCLPTCPDGHYGDRHSRCQKCHPTCARCDAGHVTSCSACSDGDLLQNGRCHHPCPKGQYLTRDGQCSGCEEGCKKCTASRHGQTSRCTRCTDPGQVAVGPTCIDTCPDATYQRGGICYGCDDQCETCRGPGQCTLCTHPFLLSDGFCVQACPQQSFSDDDGVCQSCPEHCLTCMNRQVCGACDSVTYLWRGTCVQECEQGLLTDSEDRVCLENVHAPKVTITGALVVPDQDTAQLTSQLVHVTDADTPASRLSLHVVTVPDNGPLLVSRGGREVALAQGDTFSLQEMQEGRVRFVHTGVGMRTGEMGFRVSDGQLTSEEVTLAVRVLPARPLVLTVHRPLAAVKGGNTTLTSDTLDLRSEGQEEAEISLRVVDGPRHGRFLSRRSGTTVQSFTLNDLHLGVILYSHHGNSSAPSDMAMLQASDSFQRLTFIVSVKLRLKNSQTPVVVTNTGGQVMRGQRLQISNDLLEVRAVDPSSDVIYTLVPTLNNPKKGEVMMVVPTPDSGPGRGWEDMGEGMMGAKMFRFLQRDIDEGRIHYIHNAASVGNGDRFTFDVTDMAEPPNILHNQTFHIRILTEVPEVQEDSSQLSLPTLAPGVQLGMTVLENQVVPITSSYLAFHDVDTGDRDLVYRLTSVLEEEEGSIEHIDFPFRPVLQFTQQDINNNYIVYRPPPTDIGTREKEVSIGFVLTDDADHHQLPEQVFRIRIVPVNNMPPKFVTPNPRVTVAEGTTVPLPASLLEVTDPDTLPADLTITVTEEPEFGSLEKIDKQSTVVLHSGDSFPYREVASSTFQYRHAGSEGDSTDLVFLSASDGVFAVGSTLTISILHVDKSAPVLLPSSSCHVNVTEGKTIWIEREHLAFSDTEDEDDQVTIIVNTTTAHGKLMVGDPSRTLTPGDTFTQADINQGLLRYIADGEIGLKPVTELLHFNVTDSSRNLLPSQVLAVLITPVDNQPPHLSVSPGPKVEEGGEVRINSSMIGITDIDTPLAGLKVKITSPPSFGRLVNRKAAAGSERAGEEEVREIGAEDVAEGYLTYVQSDHEGTEPIWDAFLFTVTDGTNSSPEYRFNFTIVPVNDEAPHIVTEQLFVKEGQAITLTNASMYVLDLDTAPEDLTMTLRLPPTSGTVKMKESPWTSYPKPGSLNRTPVLRISGKPHEAHDVLKELIVYEHNDEEITSDMFVLHVTDGDFQDSKQLNIIIGLLNDETPRVTVNRGLRIKAGSSTTITSTELRATDVDSEDGSIVYRVRQNPTAGRLQYRGPGDSLTPLTVDGPRSSFTQDDIDQGRIEYSHEAGELTGTLLLKFMLSDPEGNDLIDQDFFITVVEDRFPPSRVSNEELVVKEGERERITTDFLSFTDLDSDPGSLLYQVLEGPHLGHLELAEEPGVPVNSFTQSDLAADSVYYVHTSAEELYMDKFIFVVSDGTNEIIQTFYVTLTPVDDATPVVTNNGLRVQEGVRKLITEFDLKAVDLDTKEEDIVFTVMQPPVHGTLDVDQGGSRGHVQATSFTMNDIYENRVSYQHGGTEHFTDGFTFTVSDGTNPTFTMQADQRSGGDNSPPVPVSTPQEFNIDILPMDDGTPVLESNLGLEYLEKFQDLAGNYITERELKSTDVDSPPKDIVYSITKPPVHGIVEHTDHPGQPVDSFTQENVDNGQIRYMLRDDVSEDLQDAFQFDVMDAKPNVVKGNTFHIRWSHLGLAARALNVTETAGILQVPVVRFGNLKQYTVVQCQTKRGTAMSEEGSSEPGLFDFVQFSGQVQFDEWQETKMCSILINDDSIYEGPETFYVELTSPTYALLGHDVTAAVTILDEEDVPTVQFEQDMVHVNETDVYVMATLKRTGDLSNTVSVICSTWSLTATGSSLTGLESGSDFVTRGRSNSFRVIFPAGISTATCDVKVIDDSVYESAEQFELRLSDPSLPAVLGPISTAVVIIEGPNDESHVLLSAPDYEFPEDGGVVEVEVVREGSDLSHSTTVWCATRLSSPPSATPGVDYSPSSSQVTFTPGQVSQKCQLTLLDDDFDPRVEGRETFEVFLSSPVGSTLAKPYHSTVVIHDDTLDMPTFTFQQDSYVVDEQNRTVNATILRLGDLTLPASVLCYTRQLTATVALDFEERLLANVSRVHFEAGDRQKNCTVTIVDDADFEPEEDLELHLADPLAEDNLTAQLGTIHVATVIITNHDDVPRVQLEKSAYSVHEPSVKEQISTVVVRVLRTGAANQTTSVRCSTRDGSAQSGLDYNARSLRITFPPGVREVEFPVDILYNSDVEWHEAFTVLLGPQDPEGAIFGPVTVATVTILDNEVSGSLVLPAPPVVVSLLHYDDADQGTKVDPSPGYPLICVNPCDEHYPSYAVTHSLCEDAGINASALLYRWEVAVPPDVTGATPPFVQVSDSTLFTSTSSRVLDSVYFRSHFRVRCVAQPLHANGNPGVPLRSAAVTVGRNNGICNPPAFGKDLQGYHAQSFLATLKYVPPDSHSHPNTIHIRVEIPHQDGMLPLISTFPLHNIRFLLSEPVYRQQHVCSNIITATERAPLLDEGFLRGVSEDGEEELPFGPGYDFAYQFDPALRGRDTLGLYRHLDLKRCIWTFDAFYHMAELVDICGGRVVSDFTVKDQTRTHLTVRVPLHVSYLFAAAPVGWTSLEHRTEMELAFYYSSVLWRAGLETEGRLGGKLQIKRILIGRDGKLVIEFRTQAKFRGVYVISHHTAPGVESRVLAPKALAISLELQLTWSQRTFDSPHQTWRATSRYNLKDYTGMYVIELIPCAVTPTQAFVSTDPLPCTAGQPQRFEVPLSFQQTNRPVPVVYSLDTQFQLTNNLKMVLMDPGTASTTPDDWDFNGAFSRGQNLYGRVLWSPSQDLKTAYKLSIEKVYLCTGSDGYIPTYDPDGDIYNEGPQYGCIQQSSRLLFRFLILDRENPDNAQNNFQDIPFQAFFADDREELSPLLDMAGVDGFVFNVDPLYKVDSGHQWYLQVVYLIGPADVPFHRHRREVSAPQPAYPPAPTPGYRDPRSGLTLDRPRNGTNIRQILMNHPPPPSLASTTSHFYPVLVILPIIIFIVFSALVAVIVVCFRKRRRKRKCPEAVLTMKRNNLAQSRPNLRVSVTSVNSRHLSVSNPNLHRVGSGKGEGRKVADVPKSNLLKAKEVNVVVKESVNVDAGTEV
ncbi:LOW QUALITY PROTEIN: extracellular matrix organizing protein FRAS1-like [Babylonia areolata]|uniref:LOW QUALITY PROTEIN: extracellular matrix organizing protein FRAS1-like n=1 Tax=Babylonia areolata TaxID=304850 RepID=UPI003FD60968